MDLQVAYSCQQSRQLTASEQAEGLRKLIQSSGFEAIAGAVDNTGSSAEGTHN